MRRLIIGIIIGFILGTLLTAGYAAMSSNLNDRNYQKYTLTADDKVAILVTIAE